MATLISLLHVESGCHRFSQRRRVETESWTRLDTHLDKLIRGSTRARYRESRTASRHSYPFPHSPGRTISVTGADRGWSGRTSASVPRDDRTQYSTGASAGGSKSLGVLCVGLRRIRATDGGGALPRLFDGRVAQHSANIPPNILRLHCKARVMAVSVRVRRLPPATVVQNSLDSFAKVDALDRRRHRWDGCAPSR
jgi:hypothetical protein